MYVNGNFLCYYHDLLNVYYETAREVLNNLFPIYNITYIFI